MKITKTFISIFLLTFLIGYLLVPPPQKVSVSMETATAILANLPSPPIEPKVEPEILEESNNWKDEVEQKFKIKLLETGEGFHGDQIEAKSGETWFGLFKENDKYFLRSTRIKVRRVKDVVVDDDGERTGKNVSVKGKNQPIFLLKNAEMLSEGKISTLFWINSADETNNEDAEPTSLTQGFVKQYKFGERKYVLRVKTGINKKREKIMTLVLEGDGKSQVLHSIINDEEGDYLGSVDWVGDLDRDGKPDFYFDLYINDNVEYKNLFLSSQAKNEKLIKKAAYFLTTGC